MGSGLTACVRYLLFFFNLIFALTGLAVLVIGGLAQYGLQEHNYSNFVDESFRYVPIVLMVVGVVISVIAFFGCCGAFKESHCMLYAFGVFLVALFLLEITAGIAGYLYRDEIAKTVEVRIEDGVQKYYVEEDARKIMDGIQFDLACCGVKGYDDYNNNIPNSCCTGLSADQSCPASEAHPEGCFTALKNWLTHLSIILVSVGGGIAIVQLIGIIFAFGLANSIKRGYEMV